MADLDPEVLRTITQRKVVDYLRRRRGPAIAQGQYVVEVQEGRSVEIVTPERPDGLRVSLAPQRTLWGTIEFNLFVAGDVSIKRAVSVVGSAGTTILDSITELEEFDHEPWNTGQLAPRGGMGGQFEISSAGVGDGGSRDVSAFSLSR